MRDFIYRREEEKEMGVRVCGMETGHITTHLGAVLIPYFFERVKQPRPREFSRELFIKKGKIRRDCASRAFIIEVLLSLLGLPVV
jgi:hypothetical protein